eukprot:XP_028352749.1 LOW QUALITY PROTEIN: DNA-binding protein RFX8 [Physeter catodon]
MAKTLRMVLKNSRRVSILKLDLHAILHQGALDISRKALTSNPSGADALEETTEPSRSTEEFIRLAASFQLRWNFLLTAVSKAMTLWHRDSFGSWHLFHLLLLEYVIHILQSCIEEDEEDGDVGNLKEMLPDDQPLLPPDQELSCPPDPSPAQERRSPSADPPRVTLRHKGQSHCATEGSSVVVTVPGFLVDVATGNELIQVLLEGKATESTIKLNLPLERETLITLKDGQKFVIHVSDVSQSSENIYFRDSNADT